MSSQLINPTSRFVGHDISISIHRLNELFPAEQCAAILNAVVSLPGVVMTDGESGEIIIPAKYLEQSALARGSCLVP